MEGIEHSAIFDKLEAVLPVGVGLVEWIVGDDGGMALEASGEVTPEGDGLILAAFVAPKAAVVPAVIELTLPCAGQAEHYEDYLDAVALGGVQLADKQLQIGFDVCILAPFR